MKHYLMLAILAVVPQLRAQEANRVTVAVAGLFHSNQFVVETEPSQPLTLHTDTAELTVGRNSSEKISVTRAGDKLSICTTNAKLSAKSVSFGGRSGDAEFTLSIPSRFRRKYRGTLRISPSKSELLTVVEMDLETAVASVVSSEAPADAPIEFLKALAVASRSYFVAGALRHGATDFCDTTHCQFLRNPPPRDSAAARAANETNGLVLTFSNKPFAAMYSASCGGRTHTLAELGLKQHGYPYYAVECPYCRRHPDKWSTLLRQAEAASAGERQRLDLARKLGWNVVPSNDFESRRAAEGTLLSGVGHGHGLGLCQRGAAAMAREGADFRNILAHYYPNTAIDSIGH